MSTSNSSKEELEAIKEILKAIHRGEKVEELKKQFRSVVQQISPFEIPLIEQQLIKEGISMEEVLKLCDLHVELFREYLQSIELKNIPKGHPLDLLIKENELILKQAEVLGLYASALLKTEDHKQTREYTSSLKNIMLEMRKARLHYRKIQMLIFPYLERRGITAVPRVLWSREDQEMIKLRQLFELLQKAENNADKNIVKNIANKAIEIAQEASELAFRENRILFPAVYTLFSEGEWAMIADIAEELGYVVDIGNERWKTDAKPILPYELEVSITPEQVEKLPPEFKSMIASHNIESDAYNIKKEEDLDLNTGFLSIEEIEALFRSLPVEITFANFDNRVKFFTESTFHKGFVRTKTIIGRKIEYCHPPRLENIVRENVNEIKFSDKAEYKEFWTKMGEKIIRILVVPVKNQKKELLGIAEIVEDLTEVVNNSEEVKKKIVVL
ncbi:MAG: DUF438 domain-containing protein [Candidatus Brockarchaeota archaeon]|nr:DUF438 domain-containing protein [Candidatus Brockarchaeota archaeon]